MSRRSLDPEEWSSVHVGDRVMVDVTQVFANIGDAIERQDLDISTAIILEEDVASYDEIAAIVQHMDLGAALAAHVVNTAHTLMAARYPPEPVAHPFLPQFDLRETTPLLTLTDAQQEVAKVVFNRRIASKEDLAPGDVPEVDALAADDQIQLFVILFAMVGAKLAMLKHVTGTE